MITPCSIATDPDKIFFIGLPPSQKGHDKLSLEPSPLQAEQLLMRRSEGNERRKKTPN